MAKSIMVHGTIIRCMGRVSSGGQMAKNTQEISKKTSVMAMVNSDGRMAENMRASGVAGNSTVSDSTEMEKERNAKDSGSTVVVCSGLIEQIACV